MVKHSTLSKRKRWLFRLLYYPLATLMILSLAEGSARILGYRPWTTRKLDVVVDPGGRLYMPNPTLGYTALPGKYKVTLSGSYSFNITNLDNTLRVTHPLETTPDKAKTKIWIFGDSITYGWSINDEETYPWLLQQRLPEYELFNFGVNGYGTLQNLIQFREALKNGAAPKVVILTYAAWHDARNTFIRGRGKMLAPAASLGPVNQPYARFDRSGQLNVSLDTLGYREFPLMRYSALINALEESYDRYEERRAQSHEITKAIIKEFADLCKTRGIELVVAGLTSDPPTSDMLSYCRGEGLKTVDIRVDLNIKENNNLPYDSHPSAVAHRQYAQKLELFLRNDVLSKIRPDIKNN
jgi:hypothetical protein